MLIPSSCDPILPLCKTNNETRSYLKNLKNSTLIYIEAIVISRSKSLGRVEEQPKSASKRVKRLIIPF